MQELAMIPQTRRGAVRTALQAVFNTWAVGDLQPISGGVSGALIFRFHVRDRPHVLRIEPERIALRDRQRGFACMVAAAAAGAAPRVYYADPASGVAIMDFVSGRPLSKHPGDAVDQAHALGALIARVQTTPLFPRTDDYPDLIGGLLAGLSQSRFLAPGQLDPHAEGLARIRDALPWDAAALVSSHNDPNPRNILFDGERLWLIDWELAFRNDPLVDVAILTFDLCETSELEDALLHATFGKAPDRRLRARLDIIRLLTRLFYGCIVLDSLHGSPGFTPDESLAAFAPAGFRTAVEDGRLTSGAPATAHAFAKMSLRAFMDGLAAPEFDENLKRVTQG